MAWQTAKPSQLQLLQVAGNPWNSKVFGVFEITLSPIVSVEATTASEPVWKAKSARGPVWKAKSARGPVWKEKMASEPVWKARGARGSSKKNYHSE
jgi:hypothetical protein